MQLAILHCVRLCELKGTLYNYVRKWRSINSTFSCTCLYIPGEEVLRVCINWVRRRMNLGQAPGLCVLHPIYDWQLWSPWGEGHVIPSLQIKNQGTESAVKGWNPHTHCLITLGRTWLSMPQIHASSFSPFSFIIIWVFVWFQSVLIAGFKC